MKLPFPFMNNTETTSSFPWPSCGSPKTLSFRAGNDLSKRINSAFVDTPESADSRRFSTISEDYSSGESTEMVIRALPRSERLFFEPGETNSILEEAKKDGFSFKESTAVMAMDSQDPYMDFKRSMEEMVEAHGLKDWECLEELLSWYLRVNGKNNHGYIIGAFVDLLIGCAVNASPSSSSSSHDDHSYSITTHSPTSPLSFSSSTSSTSTPCLSSSLEAEDEIEKTVGNGTSSSSDV